MINAALMWLDGIVEDEAFETFGRIFGGGMALFEEDPAVDDDGMILVLDVEGVGMMEDDDARKFVPPRWRYCCQYKSSIKNFPTESWDLRP